MKKMSKKTIVWVVTFTVIFIPFLHWLSSLIYCEYLTLVYGDEFKEEYKQCSMLPLEIDHYKVMRYSKNYAEVYYVTEDCISGNILKFYKENNEWIMTSWNTVWSKHGSADGFIWPYGRKW